jgi:hypothetical protein
MTTPKTTKTTTDRKPYGSQWKRKETPMRFTDRDGDMLEAIAVNRVLDRDLMLWLFPPEKNAAPEHVNTKNPERVGTNLDRRLTKLYRNGYVDRVRTVYGGPFLYALSDRGASLLRGDDNRAPRLMETLKGDDWQEKNRTLSTLFMTHTLAIARVRAALTVAGRVAGWHISRFDAFGPELTVKVTAGQKTTTLRPDALVSLVDPNRPSGKNTLHFFLEADRSSMHHDKMARKFRSYEAMSRAHLHRDHYQLDPFRVLIVTKSQARATALIDLIAGDRVKFHDPNAMRRLFYITTETTFTEHPENIFADVWTPTHRPTERAALIPQPLARR